MEIINYENLSEAIELINHTFSVDFRKFQPKIYARDGGKHYGIYDDGKLVSFLSLYETNFLGLDILSVGSVCVEKSYQKRGLFLKMFAFLEQDIFPNYDFIYLVGPKQLYEKVGFYKVGKKIEYIFKNDQKELEMSFWEEKSKLFKKTLEEQNYKVKRNDHLYFDIVTSHNNKIIKFNGGDLLYNPFSQQIREINTEVDKLEIIKNFCRYKNQKVSFISSCLDDVFLNESYSYLISPLLNVKIINYHKVCSLVEGLSLLEERNNDVTFSYFQNTYTMTKKQFHEEIFNSINQKIIKGGIILPPTLIGIDGI